MVRSIIVLGHARSGTSVITRVIATMGAFVENSVPPDKFNEEGYWESEEMVNLNNEVLTTIGGDWPNFYHPPDGWESNPTLAPLIARAETLIDRMNKHETWSLKDPRLSVTLPFWKKLLPIERYVVLCLRNPLSSSRSLSLKRDMDLKTVGEEWFETNLWAIKNVADERTLIVQYEEFLRSPELQSERIANFIGLSKPSNVSDMVSTHLVHQNSTIEELLSDNQLGWEPKLLYLLMLQNESDSRMLSNLAKVSRARLADSNKSRKLADILLVEREMLRYRREYENLASHPYVKFGLRIKALLKKLS